MSRAESWTWLFALAVAVGDANRPALYVQRFLSAHPGAARNPLPVWGCFQCCVALPSATVTGTVFRLGCGTHPELCHVANIQTK